MRLDGGILQLAVDPGAAGQTLYFKFCSYNTFTQGNEQLSAVTAYSYTVPSALPVSGTATLVPRGSCAVSGETVYKATAGASAWDSDAYSASAYSSVSITGQISSGGALAIGLVTSVSGVSQPSVASGFYGFYPHADSSNVLVYDGLTLLWALGSSPNKNDLFQVTYDGFTIRYYYNGALVASSLHQGVQFYPYVSFYSPGASFSNVEVTVGALATPSQFVATGNCVVNAPTR